MQSAVARDRRTKAVLLAHFVGSAVTPENRSLLASLDALGPEDRKKIIETLGDDDVSRLFRRSIPIAGVGQGAPLRTLPGTLAKATRVR